MSNPAKQIDPLITVGIAVTRPAQYRFLVTSLAGQLNIYESLVVVLDGVAEAEPSHVEATNGQPLKICYVHHKSQMGLSRCRNQVLKMAPTRFVVFLDDDTEATPDLLARYRQHFADGQQVVGGSLCMPGTYPDWPAWLPTTYGSLLGIHQAEKKIWGGNFGFDRTFALRHSLCFAPALGRFGRQLWSGEDTTFVKAMEQHQAHVLFDPAIVAYHHIETSRFGLPYLLRRAYWQGRSEVQRESIRAGLRKEYRRAFGQGARSWSNVTVGALLYASVGFGVMVQLAANLFAVHDVK